MIQYRVTTTHKESTDGTTRNPREVKHGVLVFDDEGNAKNVADRLRSAGFEVYVGLRIYVGRSYIDYNSAKLRHAREDFSRMLDMIDEAMTAPDREFKVAAE